MARDLYPHLTVNLDVAFMFEDILRLVEEDYTTYHRYFYQERERRHDAFDRWLIDHDYQCGRDYQRTNDGFRFASESLATMFVLGNTK